MRLSRRELLEGLLGITAAACTGRPAGRSIEGSIVGGSFRLGHRVRDGFSPVPERWEEAGVAILGAGIAGLSSAWTLERAGYPDYLVLELEDDPGGTARSGSNRVSAYPWGAHYVPVPDPGNRPLVAILDEVGAMTGRADDGTPIWAEQILCREPEERLFAFGTWYEGLYPRIGASPQDMAELEALEKDMRQWAGVRDAKGRRAFALPRHRSSDEPRFQELDRISMADYMDRKGWRTPRIRWYAEYGCRDDFGARLADTSAWAGVHYYASRLPDPKAESAEFLTWPEGNGRLVQHLAGVAGARLRTGALVTEVSPKPDRVEVVYYEAETGKAVGVRARHAVFALPRFLARHLVTPWRDSPPAHLAETVYGSWMVANLTLSDRPKTRGFPLCWDNVLYESPSLGYVVATHQTGSDYGPTVFTYYIPFVDGEPREVRRRMLETTWEEWVGRILDDLAPSHPGIRRLVERVDVYLWGHAMVRPRPGFLWSQALRASARPLGRLRFAHTDLSGFALFEEAQYWGIRAAEDVLRAERRPFESWLA